MFATAYNPSDVPVVVDGEGRSIGGREWGTVETTDDTTAAALESGRLLLVERPKGGDLSPGATAAFEQTTDVDKRATKLDKLTKDQLVALAGESGLPIDPDNPPHKPDLVARLARRTRVEVPSRSRAPSSSDTDSTETEEA